MKKIVGLLLLSVIFASCSKAPNPDKNTVIQPLSVGYTWKFSDSTFSSTGQLIKVRKSQLGITGKISELIAGKATDLYLWNWYDEVAQRYKKHQLVCNNEEGGFYFFGGMYNRTFTLMEKTLSIKYPAKVSDTWEKVNYSYMRSRDTLVFYKQSTSTVVCESTDTLFQTGIGKIKCYKYRLFNPYYKTSEVYVFYALNIGFVGYVKITDGVVMYKKSLVSYDLTKSSKAVGYKTTLTGDEDTGKMDFYGVME